MNHLKLVVVGPSECGKSYLCNFLSDAVEQVTVDYKPTKGVRIIEYEQSISCKGKMHKVEVELWDTSGSKSYENCWPAVFRGLNGVVFVYNPNDTGHGKVLEEWQSILAQIQTLRDTQCCVIGHCKSSKTDRDVSLPLTFSRYLQFKGSISEEGEKFREEFAKFISQLVSTRMEANEQEELNIINS